MSTKAELACVYSALLLVDDDVAVTVSMIVVLSSQSLIGPVFPKALSQITSNLTRGSNLNCTMALRSWILG